MGNLRNTTKTADQLEPKDAVVLGPPTGPSVTQQVLGNGATLWLPFVCVAGLVLVLIVAIDAYVQVKTGHSDNTVTLLVRLAAGLFGGTITGFTAQLFKHSRNGK